MNEFAVEDDSAIHAYSVNLAGAYSAILFPREALRALTMNELAQVAVSRRHPEPNISLNNVYGLGGVFIRLPRFSHVIFSPFRTVHNRTSLKGPTHNAERLNWVREQRLI
jgi:hypothetical protein